MLFILREMRVVIVYYNILFVLLEKYLCLNQNQVHQALPSVFIDEKITISEHSYITLQSLYIYIHTEYVYICIHIFIYFIYIVLDIKKVHSAQHAFLVANMR